MDLGHILISLCGSADVVHEFHPVGVVLVEVLYKAAATAGDIQRHRAFVIAVFTEPTKDVAYILRRDLPDDALVGGGNIRGPRDQHFLDDGVVDLAPGPLHEHLPHGEGALIGAEFLGVHLSRLRSAVDHVQHIHRAVADVCDQVDALHRGGKLCDGCVALRIDLHPLDGDVIVFLLIGEADLLVLAEIGGKILFLAARPRQGQTGRDDDPCLGQIFPLKLFGDGRKGEDVVVLVAGLVGQELLMAFPDQVVPVVQGEHFMGEQRFGVVGKDAGLETAVGRFHVPVPVVDADDAAVIEPFHCAFSFHFVDRDFWGGSSYVICFSPFPDSKKAAGLPTALPVDFVRASLPLLIRMQEKAKIEWNRATEQNEKAQHAESIDLTVLLWYADKKSGARETVAAEYFL